MQEPTLAENRVRSHEERIVHPWVTVRRVRVLPRAGQILRSRGERVGADTVVGETRLPGGYRLLELDRELGQRVRDARKLMEKRVGDTVERDEVLARAGLLLGKTAVSPLDGTIIDMRDSRVLIEGDPRLYELIALYPGAVVEVIPQTGVVIETTGALIQGDWGTGESFRATLHCPVPGGDVPLLAAQISSEHIGGILIGGHSLDAAAIAQAVAAEVRGVIVGSIHSDLLPALQESGLSLIVTEGMGDAAMPAATFELLAAHAGEEVCFAPTPEGTRGVHKPELLCYQPAGDGEEGPARIDEGALLQNGSRVRVLRAPTLYAEGVIVSLPELPQRLASGLYAWGAEVDLESRGRVFVPFENLESIH
jgi:hypothetical protein